MKNIYWNIDKNPIKNLFHSELNVESIKLGSAYLSEYGMNIILDLIESNNIPKEKAYLYLSASFSNQNPDKLLDILSSRINIGIVSNKGRFSHGKLIMLQYNNNKTRIIMGSANFTKGGLESNIECNIDFYPTEEEIPQFNIFLMYSKIIPN